MLIFVNEEDANRYYVTPNTSTLLMDKDNPIFYIKTSDALGRTTMEKFTFTKVEPPAPPQYVTMEDFEALNAKIDALLAAQTPESFISDLRTRTRDMTQERGFPQAQLNNLINTHITRR